MAHIGEEGALGVGRVFGPPLGEFQLLDQLRQACGLVLEVAVRPLEVTRVLRHRLFGGFSLGDVAGGGVDDLPLRKGRRGPEEPAQRAVLVEIPILEVGDVVGSGARGLRIGGVPVVGVDELAVGTRQQFCLCVSQRPVPRRVHPLEIAVVARDTQHVQRQREEAIELLLCASAVDEEADLVADAREHREERFVGRADLPAEKLHHADDVVVQKNREPERRVEALARGNRSPGEIRVPDHVGDPGGLACRPDPARQPDPRREGALAAERGELWKVSARLGPDMRAPQRAGFAIDLPERPVLPAERLADRFEDLRGGVVDAGRVDERARRDVLGGQPRIVPKAAMRRALLIHEQAPEYRWTEA